MKNIQFDDQDFEAIIKLKNYLDLQKAKDIDSNDLIILEILNNYTKIIEKYSSNQTYIDVFTISAVKFLKSAYFLLPREHKSHKNHYEKKYLFKDHSKARPEFGDAIVDYSSSIVNDLCEKIWLEFLYFIDGAPLYMQKDDKYILIDEDIELTRWLEKNIKHTMGNLYLDEITPYAKSLFFQKNKLDYFIHLTMFDSQDLRFNNNSTKYLRKLLDLCDDSVVKKKNVGLNIIELDSLINLRLGGLTLNTNADQQNSSIFDKNHPGYSSTLAAANKAWQHTVNNFSIEKGTPKQIMEEWLIKHKDEYNLSNNKITKIVDVANFRTETSHLTDEKRQELIQKIEDYNSSN